MISNTTQDLELIQLETRMASAEGSITTLGAGLLLTSGGVLLALDLVNQKSWILFFQKPLRSDISSNVYLDFDTNYFKIDTSNNLSLSDTFWKKDVSNNLCFNGRVGIGLTNPNAFLEIFSDNSNPIKIKFGHQVYPNLFQVNHLICSYLFRFLTSNTATNEIAYFGYLDNYETPTIANRVMVLGITRTALNMTGDIYNTGNTGIGVAPSTTYKLNVNGSINSTSLYQNGTLIDFNTYALKSNVDSSLNTINNTFSQFLPLSGGTLTGVLSGTTISATYMTASLFTGSCASLTNLNASSITTGTLSISKGGTGATSFTANQLLIGNATTSILQSANLSWNNTSNTLLVSNLQLAGQITGVTTLNGTTGIFGTVSTTNNTNTGSPGVGIIGGIGDKLVLYPGTSSIYPYSLGINANTLWYSVPSGASHIKYVNGTAISTINSAGLNVTGIINASSNLQENSINLSSKYLLLSGGAMTGQITGVTTLNGTTGIFGTVLTTNNTNVGLPNVGVAGGTGDKLILYAGTATSFPYSLGINTNTLFYSVPANASHKFYNGGTNTLTIDSSGNLGIGTSSTSAKLHIQHSSTSTSPADGGLYVCYPSTGAILEQL